MQSYQREFIEFMVRCEVLRFGEFVTKSGRETPFFVNTGMYRTGRQIARLGEFYARAMIEGFGEEFDVLFGPAYKGIPLSVAAAIALERHHDRDVRFCFNRKEAKDHGEGGVLVGHSLRDGDRVLIVEDVITAGTSIRETVPVLKAAAAVKLAGLVVSVDRMEKGPGGRPALEEVGDKYGMKVIPIVTLEQIIEHLHDHPVDGKVLIDDELRDRLVRYQNQWGGRR